MSERVTRNRNRVRRREPLVRRLRIRQVDRAPTLAHVVDLSALVAIEGEDQTPHDLCEVAGPLLASAPGVHNHRRHVDLHRAAKAASDLNRHELVGPIGRHLRANEHVVPVSDKTFSEVVTEKCLHIREDDDLCRRHRSTLPRPASITWSSEWLYCSLISASSEFVFSISRYRTDLWTSRTTKSNSYHS